MKYIHLLLLGFLFALPFQGYSSGGKITGKITDASNGDPLFNANVLLSGTTRGTVTDANGKYTIDNIAPGKYKLRVTLISYETFETQQIEVKVQRRT